MKNKDLAGLISELKADLRVALARLEADVARVETKVDAANKGITQLMADEKIALDDLDQIDQATNAMAINQTAIANNVSAIGALANTISTDVDLLLASVKVTPGVSQTLIDKVTAIQGKTTVLAAGADATAQAAAALVPVLNGIASKGAPAPVPVPVPEPVPAIVVP
jgi:hypothetical protein